MWYTDPNHPRTRAALQLRCELCKANPGDKCVNSVSSEALNRVVHFGREMP